MRILSTILSAITEYIDTGAKKFEMDTHTHPMTKIPHFPSVPVTGFQILESPKGGKKIGLTLSEETFDGVHPKSLSFIQNMLLGYFGNHIGIREVLEFPLPKHTAAVSFAMQGFEVGGGTGKFYPTDGAEGFITYQRLSANLQATYFNHQETSFLAGITYFPALRGRAKCFLNDRAAVQHAIGAREPYPLQDREKSHQKLFYKNYGRFCSIAKKRVLVDCSGKYVRHLDYDHFWNTWRRSVCEECLVDSVVYKWQESPQPSDLSTKIAERLLQISGPNDTIAVFNRITGYLLEDFPRVVDLRSFLDSNPECNVAPEGALIAKIVLGEEYEGRIGGEVRMDRAVDETHQTQTSLDKTDDKATTFLDPLMSSTTDEEEDFSKCGSDIEEFEDATEDFSSSSDPDMEIVN